MNQLERILSEKRVEVEALRPLSQTLNNQASAAKFRGFRQALTRTANQLAIIAEVKKASPSAGVIERNYDPAVRARQYEADGAQAISVLTDRQFFQGDIADLAAVHAAVSIPVLRKDFIIDEIQIAEAAASGADAILLIVAALKQEQLLQLSQKAAEWHLDALVEVHSEPELDAALSVGASIIGVNNRDLTTFQVDLSITETLSEKVPGDVILVSESGFKTVQDVTRARDCGVDAILVGEALMRGETTVAALRAI